MLSCTRRSCGGCKGNSGKKSPDEQTRTGTRSGEEELVEQVEKQGLAFALTDGLESQAIPRIRVRIESLSDLVFGLALSFGALILIGSQPKSGLDLLVNVFIFGFSFMIVVWTWIGYRRTVAVLPPDARFALPLNIGLLFCVALEPYLFYVVITSKTVELADPFSIAYALDAGLMFLFLAGLGYVVVKEGKSQGKDTRLHPVIMSRFKRLTWLQAIVGGIYIASALPIFWVDTPIGQLRFLLWSSPFMILVVFRKPRA